jgi:predicted metal-dependent phosphoesterase TrpH
MHLHTHEDPQDYKKINYSVFELIDALEKKNFSVFSITLHDYMYDNEMMQKVKTYAKKRGLIYIPGIEKTIEHNHVLIFNMNKDCAEKINTYNALKTQMEEYDLKDSNEDEKILIIASHPFFPSITAMGKKFNKHHKLMHGIEYNSFYLSLINFNKKGYSAAKMRNKVTIGNTDAHILEQLDNTYTKIVIPKKIFPNNKDNNKITNLESFKEYIKNCSEEQYNLINENIIKYIKLGKVKVVTRPLRLGYVIKSAIKLFP